MPPGPDLVEARGPDTEPQICHISISRRLVMSQFGPKGPTLSPLIVLVWKFSDPQTLRQWRHVFGILSSLRASVEQENYATGTSGPLRDQILGWVLVVFPKLRLFLLSFRLPRNHDRILSSSFKPHGAQRQIRWPMANQL